MSHPSATRSPPTSQLTTSDATDGPSNAVILHEDKQYYPSAAQVYGEGVETLLQEEDAQPLSEPIIAPVEQKKFTVEEADLPPVFFDRGFMTDLMNFPDQIRNVALAGHLHHGKTAFMDMLVLETHDINDRLEQRTGRNRDEQLRYTDISDVERSRGLSVKAAPMSLVLQGTKGKSHLLNIIDTPGHVNFVDEVAASLRLVDGVCLVVDVVEGVQVNTEQIIKDAVLEDIPITLIINKMDRLILELKLPPADAYFKLKHVVEEVNTVIENTIPGQGEKKRVSPEKGNVLFACTDMGWCFTLQSFAKMYSDSFGGVNTEEFARRLWGDVFFNPKKRSFTRKAVEEGARRSFITFILEPIYKLYSHTISESPDELKTTLGSLGISLKPSQYKQDAKVLLKLVCEQFFGPCSAFVDMVVQHIPSPVEAAQRHLERYYTGPLDTKVAKSMETCDQDGPLVIHVTKLFNSTDAKQFHSFGRVLSGIVRPGTEVRVLGEGYSLDDEEDMAMARVSDVWIAETRYNIPVDGVPAGNWVLLGDVDNSIVKSATIVDKRFEDDEDAYIFKPISHFTESVLKIAVEPINPSELPKMLDGIRKINKSYPLITTKVEESGEHIILGTGELYMDCVMHDLRRLYADMEIKVSDPVTRFCETVVEQSHTRCYAITPNKKNKITMVAEPLEDDRIARDIESGAVSMKDPIRKTAKFFEDKYGWDKLAARSIWAFGPDDMGANILQDDTLPGEVSDIAAPVYHRSAAVVSRKQIWVPHLPLLGVFANLIRYRLTRGFSTPSESLSVKASVGPPGRVLFAKNVSVSDFLLKAPAYYILHIGPACDACYACSANKSISGWTVARIKPGTRYLPKMVTTQNAPSEPSYAVHATLILCGWLIESTASRGLRVASHGAGPPLSKPPCSLPSHVTSSPMLHLCNACARQTCNSPSGKYGKANSTI